MDHRDQLAIFGAMLPPGSKLDQNRQVLTFTSENEEGEEVEHTLTFKWSVCSSCLGRGRYTNPAIDAHGITASEMSEWEDDEREGYFEGRYDVTCENCQGKRVEPELDLEGDDPAQIAFREWADNESSYRAEREAERAFGC